MKACAYIPLHYGAEYLAASIKSYQDLVDKIYVLYSSKPTYGHNMHMQCPESEEQLRDIVAGATNKAEWVNVTAHNEGQHRGHIERFSQGYDITLSTDADEVWNTPELEQALKQTYESKFRRHGIDGFINFYKSFDKICLDGFRPIRIYNNHGAGETVIKVTCYHFGYCLPESMMRYKWAIHGHHSELRKNWIEEVYRSDRESDLHPVAIGLWNAQPFDKNTLPDILKQHPNFNKASCL